MIYHHILNKNNIKNNNKIYIEYQYKEKEIEIDERRKDFTDIH